MTSGKMDVKDGRGVGDNYERTNLLPRKCGNPALDARMFPACG